jgi:hypothetical protein
MGLSAFCALALLIAGIFLTLESPSIHIPTEHGHAPDYQHAAKNAFVGLGIYIGLFIVSLGCVCVDRFKSKRQPLAQPLLNQQSGGYAQQINQYH